MRWQQLTEDESAMYVVVLDPGEEATDCLTDFARDRGLTGAGLTAVGAFSHAAVGWFDPGAQEYLRTEVDEQCEVLSLVGDVALDDEEPVVHAHAVLGLQDGTTRGGHLLEGRVRPTLEVVLTATPARLRKTFRPRFGLALIDLDVSS